MLPPYKYTIYKNVWEELVCVRRSPPSLWTAARTALLTLITSAYKQREQRIDSGLKFKS